MILTTLFIMLLVVIFMMVAFAVLALTVGGTLGIFLFGYDILCVIFIVWIVKKIRNRKRR